jgi:hypothetical protein
MQFGPLPQHQREIRELRKIHPSLVQPSNEVYILLYGLAPYIEINYEFLPSMILATNQLHQQTCVSIKGCILLIKLKEANFLQKMLPYIS